MVLAPAAPSAVSFFTFSGLRSNTTPWCPPRIKRRIMFPPILPNPIIPSCMEVLPLSFLFFSDPRDSLRQRFGYRVSQRLQPSLNVLQVNATSAAVAVGQDLEISASLRLLHHSESILLSGHRQIGLIVAGHLQEHTRVRTAFVSLPRGMQESGTESQARSQMLAVSHGGSHGLQRLLMSFVHLNIAEQCEVIARARAIQVRAQIANQRLARRLERLGILGVGE